MNPYDKEKTRQIWKRVLGEEENLCSRAFDSERLRAMIAAEQTEARTCMALACCAGAGTDVLQCLAREMCSHVKQLEAVYYLWTGETSGAKSGSVPKCACQAEGIRQLYRAGTDAAARYRRTAEEMPEYRSLFQSLAEAKERQGNRLRRLLQRYV